MINFIAMSGQLEAAGLIGWVILWLFQTSIFASMYDLIECVRSCDQKPYLHNETKGGICIKIEFNPQMNISLLQHGHHFFVYTLSCYQG